MFNRRIWLVVLVHGVVGVACGPAEPEGPTVLRDIWTTSRYSFAPGGGGPGGGLNDDTLRVGGWGDTYVSLIQFELRGVRGTPRSAYLELYCYSSNGGSTTPMRLGAITEAWEWRAMGSGSDRERLWWNDRPRSEYFGTSETPRVGAWLDRKSVV